MNHIPTLSPVRDTVQARFPDGRAFNAPPGTTLDTFTYTLTPGGSSATVSMTVTCVKEETIRANS